MACWYLPWRRLTSLRSLGGSATPVEGRVRLGRIFGRRCRLAVAPGLGPGKTTPPTESGRSKTSAAKSRSPTRPTLYADGTPSGNTWCITPGPGIDNPHVPDKISRILGWIYLSSNSSSC
jgi:hypothetical protein